MIKVQPRWTKMAPRGAAWGALGPFWVLRCHLGRSWHALGTLLGALGRVLGASWEPFGIILEVFGGDFGPILELGKHLRSDLLKF